MISRQKMEKTLQQKAFKMKNDLRIETLSHSFDKIYLNNTKI
jgi:hypothetical protein